MSKGAQESEGSESEGWGWGGGGDESCGPPPRTVLLVGAGSWWLPRPSLPLETRVHTGLLLQRHGELCPLASWPCESGALL